MQTAIVFVVVATAAVYALWRIYDSLKHGSSACRGCKLADTCAKGKRKRRSASCHKKR